MFIYPYKAGSQSAKDLSQALGAKRIKHHNSRFRSNPRKVVINWGCSSLPANIMVCNVVNKPENVLLASNKLHSLVKLQEQGVSIPEFTTSSEEATEGVWFARTKLSGHSGSGIVVIEDGEGMVDAPLYTKYVKKKYEYRVHVFKGEVLHVQRKARNTEVPDEEVNWRIRNHGNGFIFAINEEHEVRGDTEEQAVKAVEALGLDFGAVDVIWNERMDKSFVLEVNTAPGLTGTTLEKYVEAFNENT